MKLLLHTDGASRGNPGHAGIGVVIEDGTGNTIAEIAEYAGEVTNNIAEYTALIRGLEESVQLGGKEIKVLSDSELLVKQLKGEYRVKNAGLIPLFQKVIKLKNNFDKFEIEHVRRGSNKRADELANMGIDQQLHGNS